MAQRVLESGTFSKAPRLREFLAFVVKRMAENRAEEVNEYSIGVQVFGKHPDYNPNQDNIVRVTARQLRSKLTEYYAAEGSGDEWRIEIPKGSYQVVLVANEPEAVAREDARKGRLWKKALAVGAAVLGLAVCVGVWRLGMRVWQDRSQPAYLLEKVLYDRTHRLTIVLDDPILSRVWSVTGGVMSLGEFAKGRYLDEKYYTNERDTTTLDMLRENYLVHYSSLAMMTRLRDVALAHKVDVSVVSCRGVRPEDVANGNYVLMGGVASNPWVMEIQKKLAFEHVVYPREGRRVFVNRAPRKGEQAVYESVGASPEERYYARVAVADNPLGSGKVALVGGTSRDATEAAGQFALSEAGVEEVERACGESVGKLSGFEVILETKSMAGAPMKQRVVASRCAKQ